MKLEPTAEQLELIAKAAGMAVWEMQIAFDIANHGIPEGPPIGTIARRPDGKYLATRILTVSDGTPAWNYKNLTWPEVEWEYLRQNDADSWPVIYDPTGFSELSIDLGLDWGEWGCNTLVEALSALGVKPGMNLGDIYEMVERGLDWFPPGEEPIVPRPDPGSKDAGDWIKAQVVHSGGSLWRRDGYMWRGVGHTGGRSPLPSLARPGVAVTVVIDDDGELVSDLSKLACIDGDVEELLAEHGFLPDPTAQQEPVESLSRGLDDIAAGRVSRRDDYLEPQPEPKLCSGCYQCQAPKPPRTPRLVDRLGVDEQGSRWQDRQLGEWKFDGQAWRYLELTWTSVPGGEWVEAEPSKRYGPYVEVLS